MSYQRVEMIDTIPPYYVITIPLHALPRNRTRRQNGGSPEQQAQFQFRGSRAFVKTFLGSISRSISSQIIQ